ncbi:Gamma-tubulin complex component 3 [Echinococcus granulosus]|uniref:Gamma tubulin complex component 3 n=1 Tax=Echinococcus granulosus TaxID=6210 RepID=A0A068WUW6_ECHGR|nr:Gamma-tubulin complex component 3 [Echinococcus granulosus]CDS23621.1 gamma tubulin complex component 3 [Echinococcus granulosus]
MRTAFSDEEVADLVRAIFGDTPSFNFYFAYAVQILSRNIKNYTVPLDINPDSLGFISLRCSVSIRHKLKLLQNLAPQKSFEEIFLFLVLLKRDQIPSPAPISSQLPGRTILRQINNNSMSAGHSTRSHGYWPFTRNPSDGLNTDASSSRDLASSRQTPTSLWGTHSNASTLDRGLGSRRACRAPSLSKASSYVSPVEQDLLREAILTLSGASGSLIQYDPTLDAFVPAPNLTLSPSIQTHILRTSVCGWLYNRIRSFVDGVRDDPNSGKVTLSLALSIDEQLTEYLRLVTTLEAQMNCDLETEKFGTNFSSENSSRQFSSAAPSMHSLRDGSQSETGLGKQPLTLVQLSHWLMEPKRRLKILASLADVCASLKGGALVSKVYEMSQNGGPQIWTMLTTILVNVTRTIFEMIALWIYDGRLSADTNQEFFVTINPSVDNSNLWTDKYVLRKSMVPVFIRKEQARKILLVGKSVNFLTHVCDDSLVFKDLEAIRNTRLKRIESIFDQVFDNSFDRMISTAYTHVSKHLLRILFDKYHFVDHLTACRKFLLLGQGDFIQRLMDLLEPELGLPAESIMRHRLNEILETAIRDTNAQYEDSEILQRLNVEILETADGDSGWDIFSLGYQVDGPLSTIFTPDCRLFYLKAFSFLWRLKRMEFTLSALWRDQLVLARLPHGLSADLTPILHVVQLLGAEFRHFVLQFQYYVNFEALECAWVALGAKIQSANDLDEVIEAHKAFLSNVISRCLLDQNSRDLRYHLRAIFDVIVNFSQLNQDLQDLAAGEQEIRSQLQEEIEVSARTGQWGTCDTPESREMARRKVFIEATVSPLIARIRVLASSYRTMVTEFMSMLQNHTDQSLRLLVQNLNFNVHYIDGFMEA